MPGIVTITLSPCIDKSTSVSLLLPEKKLHCKAPKFEPGGGGINVARALRKLGMDAVAIYPSGGYTGKFFNHLMDIENINSKIIETKNETRENIIVLDESVNHQYRFGMPGTELAEAEWRSCLQAVEEIDEVEFIVASGSLPPGVPLDIYATLAGIAQKKNAKFIVDTSGEALKDAAERGVYLLKPNLGELSYLAGVRELQAEDVVGAAKLIINKGMCEVVVVSMGLAGATLVTKNMIETITPPKIEMKSTVGAGDSMVAGIIFSLCNGNAIDLAVRYGVACGTAATINSGTELCNKEDADRLYPMIRTVSERKSA
ncbi:MAG: 1-phosphofructokinase family hexose kinase [Ginsengibacter sp.]